MKNYSGHKQYVWWTVQARSDRQSKVHTQKLLDSRRFMALPP